MKPAAHEVRPPLQNHRGVCVRYWRCDVYGLPVTNHAPHFWTRKKTLDGTIVIGGLYARCYCDGRSGIGQ